MNYRRYIQSLLLIFFFSTTLWAQTKQEMAVEAYAKGDFKQAIRLYEELAEEGEAATLCFNLGNAYYKDGQTAKAILNYERALLINPGMGDARFNLEMARQKTVDKIEPVGEFFLVSWKNALQETMSVDAWSIGAIVLFLLFIALLFLFLFMRIVWVKKVSFFLGLFMLLASILANVFAADLKQRKLERKVAIILAPTVTVKGSPDRSGTDLFILHEGTKIFIKSKLGDWSEIVLEDGNVGWMPSKAFEII